MLQMGSSALGIILIVLGTAFLLVTPFLLRAVPRMRPVAKTPNLLEQNEVPSNPNALLLVQPGGRIAHINQQARDWFQLLPNEQPNLERLARRVRPADTFLKLCVQPGKARFTLHTTLIEAVSYTIPYQNEQALMVTMLQPQLAGLQDEQQEIPSQTIAIFNEVSQAMTASLELETTITNILESIDRLIPSDFSELTIWNQEHHTFKPYRYLLTADGNRELEETQDFYQGLEGLSGYIFNNQKTLLLDDINTFQEARPVINRQKYPFRSYLGIPLEFAGTIIGTIELTARSKEAFTHNDLNVLQTLAGHAAVAVQNAIIHSSERQRAHELASLAELSRIGNRLSETTDLYGSLTNTMAPLLEVNYFGFLTFDLAEGILAAQVPFIGVSDQFAELYRTEVKESSPAEGVIYSQDIIITSDVENNRALKNLKLNHLAHSAGMQETVLIPLTSNRRTLGYIQIADKADGTTFNDDDLRFLMILAGQVTPIIENHNLINDSRRRTQRAESLRRVASLAASSATIDEIIKFCLLELSHFLQADQIFLYILDDNLNELQLHDSSAIGLPQKARADLSRLNFNQIDFHKTATSTAASLLSKDFRENPLSPAYTLIQEKLPGIRSAMAVPLVIRDRGIGEIIIGNKQRNFFAAHDLQSIDTAAGQIASAIERSSLYAQTDESLQLRVDQLTALTRIGRELNTTLNHKHLLQLVYDEALHTTKADSGSILLFHVDPETQAPDEILLTLGQVPAQSLTTLELQSLKNAEPVIIEDYRTGEHTPPTENTRSSLIVPIAYQGQNTGLIHLHSIRAGHFDQTTLEITQALAIQAAIAIGNAQRYQDQLSQSHNLNRRVDALGKLLETTQDINLEMPLDRSLELIAAGIQESNTFEIALIYLFDPEYDTLKAVAGAGLPDEVLEEIKDIYMPWSNIKPLVETQYNKGGLTFFIPYEERPDIPPLIPEYALLAFTVPDEDEGEIDIWQPGDRLVAPLYDSQNNPLGIIAVDAPRNGLRPDSITLETLQIFATEAVLIIDSYQKVHQLRTQVETIEAEIKRSASVTQGAQTHLSLMLNKDLEQTIAIQQLHERAHNIRVGLDIAETVNRQPDRSAVLNSLASQIITQMNLDIALVAESSGGNPRIINELGSLPDHANPSALLGQRNPIRHTIQSGEPIFIPNVDENTDWRNTPLLKNLNAKGFISIPIANNGHVEASILAISQSPMPAFTQEDQQVFELIANQVSITLQNLSLLTETRRRLREVNLLLEFSRQLGSLDSQEILGTLVESIRRVLSLAHGVMVSLWDESQRALIVIAASGYTDNETLTEVKYGFGEALPGQAYTQGIALNVSEIDFANQYNLSEENLLLYRQATGGRLPISSLLVPIKAAENVLGVITLDNFNTPAAFNEEDKALVTSLAQQTALTLENARLFEEAQRFNEELEQRVSERTTELAREHRFTQTMLQISSELASSLDLDMVLNRSLEMLNEAMDAEQSTIVIVRPGQTDLINRAGAGIHKSPPIGGRPSELKIGEGLAGWVIQYRRSVIIPDLLVDDRWIKDHAQTSVYRSCLAVPLTVGADALGALLLYHRDPDKFDPDQLNAVQATANQFAVTINNGELFKLIRDQAENLGSMLRKQVVEATRSKAMLEGVADGVLVTDANNEITLFNDAAEKTLEMPREDVIGKTLDDFVGLFGAAAQSWMETIENWSADPKTVKQIEMYSERVVMEDGRVVSVHLAPVSDQNEFLGTISIFRDITHQVEVDRLKSEFVATVSHELRTPMTPIKGYVEFLIMGGAGELNEQQTQFLDIIKSNIDRLSILVNDLLDVSRIEAGKVALSFEPTNLADIISNIINDIQGKAAEESKTINFTTNIPEGIPEIYGDQERVHQILYNLTDNAFKYSPEGSTVTIAVSEIEDFLQIDITDQGIGIFPDEQDRVFERFYRGENQMVMASAGTGLGLPIVKELVEMHNGRIWVSSAGIPGQGSTFSFTLPTHAPNRENAAQILI